MRSVRHRTDGSCSASNDRGALTIAPDGCLLVGARHCIHLRLAFRALRERADQIGRGLAPAQMRQWIEFVDELLGGVDCARVF